MENDQQLPINNPVGTTPANSPKIPSKSGGLRNILRALFGHSLRRSFFVLGAFIVILSIPLTLLLVKQQQDLRQRASEFGYNTGSNCYSNTGKSDGCSCFSDSQCSSRSCINNKCQVTLTGAPSSSPSIQPQPTSGSGTNCNAYSGRGNDCSCSSGFQCASQGCSGGKCIARTTGAPSPSANPSPTSTSCNSSTNKPASCTCYLDTQCASKSCVGANPQQRKTGTCSGTAGAPSPSANPSPTSTSCNSSTNKPASCTCYLDTQCASKSCVGAIPQQRKTGTCSGPSTTQSPSITVKPTNTPIDVCAASKYRAQACTCTDNSQCRSGVCSSGKCAVGAKDVVPPGSTGLKLSIKLPGIGAKTATVDDNPSPKNTSRIVRAILLDSNNTPVNLGSGATTGTPISLHFEGGTYSFTGPINLGTTLDTGNYLVKLSVDNSLFKQIPGIVTITKGSAENATSTITLISGDMNGDNTLGVSDWTNMIACMRNEPACTADLKSLSDLNDNGETDILDIQLLQRGFAKRDGD